MSFVKEVTYTLSLTYSEFCEKRQWDSSFWQAKHYFWS